MARKLALHVVEDIEGIAVSEGWIREAWGMDELKFTDFESRFQTKSVIVLSIKNLKGGVDLT